MDKKIEQDALLGAMEAGVGGEFWNALKEVIDDEIEDLEERIHAVEDWDEGDRRTMIAVVNFLRHFKTVPNEIIDQSKSKIRLADDYDPFEKAETGAGIDHA